MNYYKFHIGDYAGHTRNLSLLEDLAYRRLLDAYYLAEGPLNGSSTDVARSIGMREHLDEVEYVLKSFFELVDGAWRNKRADAEIAHYLSNKEKASKAGKASAERRLNGRSTDVEAKSTNVEKVSTDVQPTINHKPIISNTPIPPSQATGGESAGSDVGERFERFWKTYPRKVGKDAARRAFAKRKPDEGLLAKMLASIASQSQTVEWQREGGRFVPNPATWLNQGRWQDGEGEEGGVADGVAGGYDWRKNPIFAGVI